MIDDQQVDAEMNTFIAIHISMGPFKQSTHIDKHNTIQVSTSSSEETTHMKNVIWTNGKNFCSHIKIFLMI
jgi:hypothetical protein